jgi:biotin transport system substrate-specific component
MILTKTKTIVSSQVIAQTLGIALFAAITGLAARITIPLPFTPIPFTLQVFVVLLAGMTLGARGGALSQLAYLGAITAGMPLDARLMGPAVWLQPTAGYLVGFVAAAYAVGWIAERWSGRTRGALFIAGLAGVACVYFFGVLWLSIFFLQGDLAKGILAGAVPFLVIDSIKALMAASATDMARQALVTLSGGRHGIR